MLRLISRLNINCVVCVYGFSLPDPHGNLK